MKGIQCRGRVKTPSIITSCLLDSIKDKLRKFCKSPESFTRDRKITFEHLIGLILQMSADRNQNGYDIILQNYFESLNLPSAKRSSLCEARQKVDWQAFEFLLSHLASVSAPQLWRGHALRAIDGTKIRLPRSREILGEFKTRINGSNVIEEHYPLAMVATSFDVMAGRPVGARIGDIHASEREFARELMSDHAEGTINLLDRGLDGVEFWSSIQARKQYFVARLRIGNGESVVRKFLREGAQEQIVELRDSRQKNSIRVRLVRGRTLKNGQTLVVATNLLDQKKYVRESILELYGMRWRIETCYGRCKSLLAVENFHARTVNGVRQEFFANLVVLSMAASLVQASETSDSDKKPNVKGAIETLRKHLPALLAATQNVKRIIRQMIKRIAQVVCLRQRQRSYPRYSRQPVNRWSFAKRDKVEKSKKGVKYG